MNSFEQPSPFYEISEKLNKEITIRFKGKLDVETAAKILETLCPLITDRSPFGLTIDLNAVTAFDDFGVLVLLELKHLLPPENGFFNIINVSDHLQGILAQVDFESQEKCALPPPPKRSLHILVRLGDATILHTLNIRLMIAFIGSVVLAMGRVLLHPKSLRVNDTISHMENTGVAAIPIVALISFLLGLIIAFMSSLQLQQFGANIYVASLVALAMVSELGPIMTAIIVAGRTGSACR